MMIRRARRDQAESLRRIMRAAIRSGCAGCYGLDAVKSWTAPGNEQFQFRVPARAFVAADQGRLMGFAGWRTDGDLDNENMPRISAMFVAPDFAGRGLGKMLAKSVEEDIRDNGYGAAYLYASLNAVPFYLGLGYRQGPRKAMAVADDIYVAVVRMDKDLLADTRTSNDSSRSTVYQLTGELGVEEKSGRM